MWQLPRTRHRSASTASRAKSGSSAAAPLLRSCTAAWSWAYGASLKRPNSASQLWELWFVIGLYPPESKLIDFAN